MSKLVRQSEAKYYQALKATLNKEKYHIISG
jgi:hypothetical protein